MKFSKRLPSDIFLHYSGVFRTQSKIYDELFGENSYAKKFHRRYLTGSKYASELVMNFSEVFLCFIWRGVILINTKLTARKYFKAKSFFSISSYFMATNIINTDINFWKAWAFLMGVNISNKEYNFFIITETAVWQFFLCTALFEYTPVILNSCKNGGP